MSHPIHPVISFNLGIMLALTPCVTMSPAQAGDRSSSCQTALQAVKTQLQEKTKLTVVSVDRRNIAEVYPDYPKGRPEEYVFALRGQQATNLLNSPRLMTTLATQVIRNCESASFVMFGLANSGYTVLLGLMPDGSVKPFECLEPGRGSSQRQVWGKTFCV